MCRTHLSIFSDIHLGGPGRGSSDGSPPRVELTRVPLRPSAPWCHLQICDLDAMSVVAVNLSGFSPLDEVSVVPPSSFTSPPELTPYSHSPRTLSHLPFQEFDQHLTLLDATSQARIRRFKRREDALRAFTPPDNYRDLPEAHPRP